MNVFEHELWTSLRPYARLSDGRDNLDLLQLPNDLRAKALAAEFPCVACGQPCRVFRARVKSGRSRVAGRAEERRLFYAATCPASVNAGCARSRAAKSHKRVVRSRLGGQREVQSSISVQVLDSSGLVLYEMISEVREPFKVDLPLHAAVLSFVPKGP